MVSAVVETKRVKIDRLIWVVAFLLLAVGIGGYYYFADQKLLLRVAGLLLTAGLIVILLSRTTQGRNAWFQWLEALQEVRKMVWPTRQETVQTTLAVVAMVFVTGLLLWTADFLLLRVVGYITGHWGV